MLDLGIDLNAWPWIWLIVAVVFALIELTLLGGMFILLPFAISAFAASILGFYDVAVEIQWAVFVFGGGLIFLILYQWLQRFVGDNELEPGVGANRLIGQTAIVTMDINPHDTDRRGRVSVDGETWGALTPGDDPLPAGSKVRVAAVQGTRVVVEPIEPEQVSGDEPPDQQPPEGTT